MSEEKQPETTPVTVNARAGFGGNADAMVGNTGNTKVTVTVPRLPVAQVFATTGSGKGLERIDAAAYSDGGATVIVSGAGDNMRAAGVDCSGLNAAAQKALVPVVGQPAVTALAAVCSVKPAKPSSP